MVIAARRRTWWVVGASAVVLLVAAAVVVIALGSTSSVVLKNDGKEHIRLSGCSIDDSLDLAPSQTGSVDVPGAEGCTAFDRDGTRYIGCLTLSNPHPLVVLVRQSLRSSVTARDCEDIG